MVWYAVSRAIHIHVLTFCNIKQRHIDNFSLKYFFSSIHLTVKNYILLRCQAIENKEYIFKKYFRQYYLTSSYIIFLSYSLHSQVRSLTYDKY